MTVRKTICGLCAICALLFSALAAQGASAAIKGTTAFTCVQGAAPKNLWGEHCLASKPATGSPKQEYGHVAIAQDTTTDIEVTNKTTEGGSSNAVIEFEVSGVLLKLTATEVTGLGSLTNKLTASGEHYIHATGTLHYLGVTTNQAGCLVTNLIVNENTGTITTAPLTTTTEGTKVDKIHIQPESGFLLIAFKLTGCTNFTLNKTYEIFGSVGVKTNGATLETTEAGTTEEGTLRVGGIEGIEAGLGGKLTIKGKDPKIVGDTFKPISETTVET